MSHIRFHIDRLREGGSLLWRVSEARGGGGNYEPM